jgi:DNA polymerase-3 subunit delta
VKANAAQMSKALDAGGQGARAFLLYGPDEAGSQALLTRLVRAMGSDAERIDLELAALKADPTRLTDEAASMGLFGEKRFIVIRWEGREDPVACVQAFLDAPVAGNPVAIIAGGLKTTAGIVKLMLAHPEAMACASYLPNQRDLEQIAAALAQEQGLRLTGDCAGRIVRMAGGDRALMARELEKLALYLDAAPERPAEVESSALDAVSAVSGEVDQKHFIRAVLGGQPVQMAQELARLKAEGGKQHLAAARGAPADAIARPAARPDGGRALCRFGYLIPAHVGKGRCPSPVAALDSGRRGHAQHKAAGCRTQHQGAIHSRRCTG